MLIILALKGSIPDITDARRASHLLRSNGRTKLPPPLARSPMKTALGSSPRRQSSLAPRMLAPVSSSPLDHASSADPTVNRRLDFDQEPSLQETPLVNGIGSSGLRRTKRRSDIYDLSPSPVPAQQTIMEESIVEELLATESSAIVNAGQEESYVGSVGDDSGEAMEGVDQSTVNEESEVAPEPVKQPAKRGRKRKSDAIDSSQVQEEQAPARASKRLSDASAVAKVNKAGPAPPKPARGRPKKVAQPVEEEEPSTTASDGTAEHSDQEAAEEEEQEPTPPPAKPRGRPPAKGKAQAKAKAAKEDAKEAPTKEKEKPAFKKPKALADPEAKSKSKKEPARKKLTADEQQAAAEAAGTIVDVYGRPLSRSPSKSAEDAQTTRSTMSRFSRGRSLMSVFRRTAADDAPRSRHGRPILKPINFWNSDKIVRERDGTIGAVDRWIDPEPPAKPVKRGRKAAAKPKRAPSNEPVEELEEWEENAPGCLDGVVAGWPDPNEEVDLSMFYSLYLSTLFYILSFFLSFMFCCHFANTHAVVAWSEIGMEPRDVPGANFKYSKITQEDFLGCGIVELPPGGVKRPKNSRRMHMVFFVASGTVEVTVHQSEFVIHRGGVFQVPRGMLSHVFLLLHFLFFPTFFYGLCACEKSGKSRLRYARCASCATVVALCLLSSREISGL